jgi:hypothetical protein
MEGDHAVASWSVSKVRVRRLRSSLSDTNATSPNNMTMANSPQIVCQRLIGPVSQSASPSVAGDRSAIPFDCLERRVHKVGKNVEIQLAAASRPPLPRSQAMHPVGDEAFCLRR